MMDTARMQRGAELAKRSGKQITREFGSIYRVPGSSKPYTVDVAAKKCTCMDSKIRKVTCKHVYAAGLIAIARNH